MKQEYKVTIRKSGAQRKENRSRFRNREIERARLQGQKQA